MNTASTSAPWIIWPAMAVVTVPSGRARLRMMTVLPYGQGVVCVMRMNSVEGSL